MVELARRISAIDALDIARNIQSARLTGAQTLTPILAPWA